MYAYINYHILQIKRLEAWGDIERQHLGALSMAKESLHSVVCRVPLIEGAKVSQMEKFSCSTTELFLPIKTLLLFIVNQFHGYCC